MEFANPFAASGSWYKGNLHIHSSGSDGAQAPEEVVRRYAAAGYHFLAMTDHRRVTPVPSVPEGFQVLSGAELEGDVTDVGDDVHVVGFGLTRGGDPPARAPVPELIGWIRERGGEAFIAHPHWSGLIVKDLLQWEGSLGIEVFNASCHLSIAKGYARAHWDDLLGRKARAWGFATDDSHQHHNDHRPEDTACAWIMVKARALTRDALVEAIRGGLFYSSWGPAIHDVTVTDSEVRVPTSPVKRINFVAQRSAGESFTAIGTPTITEATYRIRGHEDYVRVECVDAEGRWAWSNPMFAASGG
jgi:hypothetical protein